MRRLVNWWNTLGPWTQIYIGAALWAVFVLLWIPQFADLLERAVWGQS